MIEARPGAQRQPQHRVKPTCLHLGCGDEYREGWLNVDANPDSTADVVADVTDTPWSFAEADSVKLIEANHLVEHIDNRDDFFIECARVLEPGGELTISVPLGVNAKTDDDHSPPCWTWGKPERFSQSHRRPWDPDIPLELINRDVEVWLGGPLAPASPLFRAAARVWPAWAAERCFAGELTAIYRRTRDA